METLLGLTYRVFNRGRTPQENRQYARERQYSAERQRVVEQRPCLLPAARSDLSQASLTTHPQPSCPLFTTLPPEIRQRIYIHVLGGGNLHLTHISKRIVCQRLESTNPQPDNDERPTGGIPLQMPPSIEWENGLGLIPRPGQFSSLPIALLQTCHAIYAEATPVLYNSNTFSMSSPLILLYLKDYVLPPQHFNEIRHLQLVPWVYFDTPEHHLKRVHEPYDKETWPRFWDSVAEMDLMSLGLFVEYWGKGDDVDCSLTAKWIQPLTTVQGLRGVGILLRLRVRAWDTRRLKGLEEAIEKIWRSES